MTTTGKLGMAAWMWHTKLLFFSELNPNYNKHCVSYLKDKMSLEAERRWAVISVGSKVSFLA